MPNQAPTGSAVVLSQLGSTSTRALAASDVTDPMTQFYWDPANGGNGHIYQFVNEYLSWDIAATAAQNSSLSGVSGYLVTITSAGEQSFVAQHLKDFDVWIGTTDAAIEGTFKWIAGPEAGQNLSYSNWALGEPNGPAENYGMMWGNGHPEAVRALGTWNDIYADANVRFGFSIGYIAEFSGAVTVNTPAVTAAGAAFTQGRTLYADASQITDPDGMGTIAWHWQRSSDNGSTWSDISGATQASYTLAQADVGKQVRSKAIYVDGGGALETVFSAKSSAIAGTQSPAEIGKSYIDIPAVSLLTNGDYVVAWRASPGGSRSHFNALTRTVMR
jgi:hypothetical protein